MKSHDFLCGGEQGTLLLTQFQSVKSPLSHQTSSSQSGGVWRGHTTRTHHVPNPHEGEPGLYFGR